MPVKSPPAFPVGLAPETQENWPLPLVVSNWPFEPSPLGRVKITEDVTLSGAFRAIELLLALPSRKTNLLAIAELVLMVMSPSTVLDPELIVPVVSMLVTPSIRTPDIVPPLISGVVNVFANRV